MKVILQQDVKGHGKKGQMVDVSDGYARNFLLPRKLAVEASAENINTMKMQDKARRAREAEERQAAMDLSNRLKECPVKIVAKAGQGGRLFGSQGWPGWPPVRLGDHQGDFRGSQAAVQHRHQQVQAGAG